MNIEQLKQEERKLRKLLTENIDNQKAIHTAAFVAKFGVDIGDTIEFLEGKKPMKGIVCRFNYYMYEPCGIYCILYNSDGKLGKREASVSGFPQSITKITKKS